LHGATLAGAFFGAGGFNHALALACILAFAAVLVGVAAALRFAFVGAHAHRHRGFFGRGWRGGLARCFATACGGEEASRSNGSDGSGANWIFHCATLYDETAKRYGAVGIFRHFSIGQHGRCMGRFAPLRREPSSASPM